MKLGGIATLVALLGIASCRYQNMHTMGSISAAPYDDLDCFEEDNDEGFSFAVPFCSCNPRLRYSASDTGDGLDIRYEYESDSMRMVSRSIDRVDEMYINGRRLADYGQCNAGDKAHWDKGIEMFTSMWENYEPVIDDLFRICTEDRLDLEMKQALKSHFSTSLIKIKDF